MGFKGFVVSDWNAVAELIKHGYAADRAHAATTALTAGVDMEMVSDTYRTDLPALLDAGAVSSATLDTAVRRILRVKILKACWTAPTPPRPNWTPRRNLPGARGRRAQLRAAEECAQYASSPDGRHHRADWAAGGRPGRTSRLLVSLGPGR